MHGCHGPGKRRASRAKASACPPSAGRRAPPRAARSLEASRKRPTTAPKSRWRSVSGSVSRGDGDIGEAFPKRRYESSQLAAVLLDVGPKQLLRSVLDVVGERLDPGSVGQGRFLVRAPIEHDRSLGARLERSVDGKARLADPRLAGDQRQAALGLGRLFEQLPQAHALGGAPHEPARRHLLKAERQRQRWPFLAEWLPGDLDRVDRLGKPFQRERADRLEGVSVPSAREMSRPTPWPGSVRLGRGRTDVPPRLPTCRSSRRRSRSRRRR